jgi:hypothetical protein
MFVLQKTRAAYLVFELECCTDFHSYYEEPRNHPETSWSWDPSLKTFVCTCGGKSTSDSVPPSSGESEAEGFHHDFPDVADAVSTPSRAIPEQINAQSTLTCMWGDCGCTFLSLSDLAEHVNLVHLVHLCHPSSTLHSSSNVQREIFPMACQWKDCSIYSTAESVPGPSSGDIDSILGVLSSHLFHDHLGLNSSPTATHSSELLQSQSDHISTNAPQQLVGPSSLPSSEDDGQAGHVCRWSSCRQTFNSLDDLTSHLTSVHVGAGKTSYDCYWQDCLRHGESGFASKQKLCRHLQVRNSLLAFFHGVQIQSI